TTATSPGATALTARAPGPRAAAGIRCPGPASATRSALASGSALAAVAVGTANPGVPASPTLAAGTAGRCVPAGCTGVPGGRRASQAGPTLTTLPAGAAGAGVAGGAALACRTRTATSCPAAA
ncbi:hypothetical protein BST12_29715, partial [Mycobacterium angelicum]